MVVCESSARGFAICTWVVVPGYCNDLTAPPTRGYNDGKALYSVAIQYYYSWLLAHPRVPVCPYLFLPQTMPRPFPIGVSISSCIFRLPTPESRTKLHNPKPGGYIMIICAPIATLPWYMQVLSSPGHTKLHVHNVKGSAVLSWSIGK